MIIKLALSPVTWKNFMSSAKMRTQTEIHEINASTRRSWHKQETMALYRKTGVNPLAGCLPALLQMPILYAMFVSSRPTLICASSHSCGQMIWEHMTAFGPHSPSFYGAHVSGFTVLMAASTFFYMRLSMGNQPPQPQQPGMPNMKVIQQMFPFMMLFFFNKFVWTQPIYRRQRGQHGSNAIHQAVLGRR